MRDDLWLQERFDQIWGLFFPDVEKRDISIRWKGRWKNKFGHISKSKQTNKTEIVVNKLFKDFRVPEEVVKLTIAHEIVHYAHGFHSHLPKLYAHPHKGGVVNKELKKRGFGYALKFERQWIKSDWWKLYQELYGQKKSLKLAARRVSPPKQQFSLFPWLKLR
ncbi:MAG: hypothetical protein Q7R96_06445 [Nanoarchaeota archaeon]|nr:hypothetical protein [Nanoarchaeota archaeon]